MVRKKDNSNFLILGGIALIAAFLFLGGLDLGNGGIPGTESKKKVTCNAIVGNPILRSPSFKVGTSCSSAPASAFSCLFASVSSNTLSIADTVNVVLTAGGKTDSTTIKLFELFETEEVQLTLCVDEEVTSGTLEIVQDNLVVDSLDVNF